MSTQEMIDLVPRRKTPPGFVPYAPRSRTTVTTAVRIFKNLHMRPYTLDFSVETLLPSNLTAARSPQPAPTRIFFTNHICTTSSTPSRRIHGLFLALADGTDDLRTLTVSYPSDTCSRSQLSLVRVSVKQFASTHAVPVCRRDLNAGYCIGSRDIAQFLMG